MTAVTVPPCLVHISRNDVNCCRFSEIHGYRPMKIPCQVPGLHACSKLAAGTSVSASSARAGWRLCVRIFRPPLLRIAPQFIPADAGKSNMSSELIKHVSDASFEADVLKASQPVLVDYWAEWCGPCKMIAPILDDLAETYKGRLQIVKLNVDENRDTPAKYGIRGIPTLMLFRDGNVAATKVGALSKAQLAAFLDANL